MFGSAVRRMAVNLIIIAMITTFYFAISSQESQVAVGNNVYYNGKSDTCVAIQCAVAWDTDMLPLILDELRTMQIKITFFVDAEYVQSNASVLEIMAKDGHELGVLGKQSEDINHVAEHAVLAKEAIKTACGLDAKLLYCADVPQTIAKKAAKAAGDMICVSCTYDLLCGRGEADDIIVRAKKALYAGNIITVTPTRAFLDAISGIVEMCDDKPLTIVPTGSIIGA